MAVPTVVLFSVIQSQQLSAYKSDFHHYCGYFSDVVLPTLCIDDRIVLRGKQFPFSGVYLIDSQTDGIDTIINNKKLFYIDNNTVSVDDNVYNTKQQLVGKVTNLFYYNGRRAILLQDGFKHLNIHLTNLKVSVVNKSSPIAYAGRMFQTKLQLIQYLAELNTSDHIVKATLYHVNGTSAQLIVHCNGLNISNTQLRSGISPALL